MDQNLCSCGRGYTFSNRLWSLSARETLLLSERRGCWRTWAARLGVHL